jgi:parallel beta-helix repeat protein
MTMVGLLALGAATIHAATIHVSPAGNDANDGLTWPTSKASVQAGLNASAAGDEVWVAAGTYVGCITLKAEVALYGGFGGTETDLFQRDWVANVTVLDGNQAGSVVTAPTGATPATRVDGFTITNGKATYGTGINCVSSSPTITNNNISGNGLLYTGAAVYCASSSAPIIANNRIAANVGGGVSCSSSSPLIANNAIVGNTKRQGSGAGISCSSSSSPTIINNIIIQNVAYPSGGGIHCSQSSPTVTNNTIVGNSAPSCGGIYCESGSPIITNSIIASNSSGVWRNTGTVTLRHNCVYGNKMYNYQGIADPSGTSGNRSVDPQFSGAAYGRWHIQPGSPCRDAGDDGAIQADWTDVDGQTRKQGPHVDIGADESDGTSWPSGPAIVVRVRTDGDDANDGSSWVQAKRTVQAAIDAAAAVGGDVWVAAGTYVERIILPNYVHVYAGFAGVEADRSQRDWSINVAVLDGNKAGSVVTAMQPGYAVNTIDGFTILNGSATNGGGIYCSDASPTISNNTIAGNKASSLGGGVNCRANCSMMVNNTIKDNTARLGGGGIYGYASSPMIVNNTIVGNRQLEYSVGGGGIYCGYWSCPLILNNRVAGNSAYYGGGICSYDSSSPTIANNLIVGNTSSTYAGGIYCWGGSPALANNTIAGNIAATDGGGIYCTSSRLVIQNTIVAFNSSGIYKTGLYSITLRQDCVYANVEYNYSGLPDPTGTNSNISADPLFASVSPGPDGIWGTADDTFGDLRLLAFSPCIDAGNNADVPADTADLDGDGDLTEPLPLDLAGGVRFLDDPQVADTGLGTPPIVDMGAYERCRPIGDVDGDWLTDVVDLLYLVDAFGTASGDAGYDPRCDFNSDGAVDVVDLLDLVHNFGK